MLKPSSCVIQFFLLFGRQIQFLHFKQIKPGLLLLQQTVFIFFLFASLFSLLLSYPLILSLSLFSYSLSLLLQFLHLFHSFSGEQGSWVCFGFFLFLITFFRSLNLFLAIFFIFERFLCIIGPYLSFLNIPLFFLYSTCIGDLRILFLFLLLQFFLLMPGQWLLCYFCLSLMIAVGLALIVDFVVIAHFLLIQKKETNSKRTNKNYFSDNFYWNSVLLNAVQNQKIYASCLKEMARWPQERLLRVLEVFLQGFCYLDIIQQVLLLDSNVTNIRTCKNNYGWLQDALGVESPLLLKEIYFYLHDQITIYFLYLLDTLEFISFESCYLEVIINACWLRIKCTRMPLPNFQIWAYQFDILINYSRINQVISIQFFKQINIWKLQHLKYLSKPQIDHYIIKFCNKYGSKCHIFQLFAITIDFMLQNQAFSCILFGLIYFCTLSQERLIFYLILMYLYISLHLITLKQVWTIFSTFYLPFGMRQVVN